MKKTILVVDDYTSIRQLICETLERRGYFTLRASNGNEAFQVLNEHAKEVSLVVSDYMMPECNGFELLQKIKANPVVASVPVIFLTAEKSPDKMRAAKKAGLDAWISKPYRVESFFAQIEMALSVDDNE